MRFVIIGPVLIVSTMTVLMIGSISSDPKVSGKESIMFPACPDRPNCVSSLADQPDKRVEPLTFTGSVSESLRRIEDIVRSMPRTKITSSTEGRLQAEFRTRLGYVDDILFVGNEDEGVIHVRSASRTGYWDFGVNRRRVERIREMYKGVED